MAKAMEEPSEQTHPGAPAQEAEHPAGEPQEPGPPQKTEQPGTGEAAAQRSEHREQGAREPELPAEEPTPEQGRPESEGSLQESEQQEQPSKDQPAEVRQPAEEAKESAGEPKQGPGYLQQLPPAVAKRFGEQLLKEAPTLTDLVKGVLRTEDILSRLVNVGEEKPKAPPGAQKEAAEKPDEKPEDKKEHPAYFQQIAKQVIAGRGDQLAQLAPTITLAAQRLLMNLDKLSRTIIIPDPKTATPEQMAAFHEAMGLPRPGEDYEINMESAKGLGGVKEFAQSFKAFAKDAALRSSVAQRLFDRLAAIAMRGEEARVAAGQKARDTFDARLKVAVGNGSQDISLTKTFFREFLDQRISDEMVLKKLEGAGLCTDTGFAISMAGLQKILGDLEELRPRQGRQGHYSDEWKKSN